MPRTNIDYSKTSIYKICCKDFNITEIYVGHTTDMRKRKNQHKSACNNENNKNFNFNVYQFIRDNGNWDNWDMIEVERYNAIDGYDATKRERYWIEELKSSLNSYIPTRTHKEYYEDNKEILAEKYKKYYENNKEYIDKKQKEYTENNKENIKEKNKKYYEKNKEKIHERDKEYRENNKENIKEKNKKYYEKNKEKIHERDKKYREDNKIKIAEKRKEKITCECGCIIRMDSLSGHLKTKKHIELMTKKEDIL